ncbi:DUF1906 domain-containing protein [Streptomyces sp. NPDC053431]|uniref:DUF1906 domain-containing protein n=1 Tax=Streptomyces sp. NPDC053431 TaxID=3365703 RepID=UPI0037D8D005
MRHTPPHHPRATGHPGGTDGPRTAGRPPAPDRPDRRPRARALLAAAGALVTATAALLIAPPHGNPGTAPAPAQGNPGAAPAHGNPAPAAPAPAHGNRAAAVPEAARANPAPAAPVPAYGNRAAAPVLAHGNPAAAPVPAHGNPGAPAPAYGNPAAAPAAHRHPPAAAHRHPAAAAPAPVRGAPVPRYFAGRAFDTCQAPSLAVMRAWQASPYRAVGVYFGGRGRGCPVQRELTPGWVASVNALGWRVLPLFVGSQAPCVNSEAKRRYAIGRTPWLQGTQEAGEAVRAARALGFAVASPLYLDIEAYRSGDSGCTATTVRFVRAWSREVRRLGYVPGFYSSAETGIRQLERERRAGTKDLPSVVWFARWRGVPALDTESVLASSAWRPHARIHQYAGDVTETHGGRRMVIDRSVVDAPVARIGGA